MSTTVSAGDGELLYGVAAIAAFLGVKRRQGLHLVETGRVPHFRIGRVVCARRSTLRDWLAAKEAGRPFSAPGAETSAAA